MTEVLKRIASAAAVLVVGSGCFHPTTVVWLAPEPGQPIPTDTIKLEKKGAQFAIIEARATKGADTRGQLMKAAVAKAKQIGASSLDCSGPSVRKTAGFDPTDVSEKAAALTALAEAVTKLVKQVIALPFTAHTEMISKKTVYCDAYR